MNYLNEQWFPIKDIPHPWPDPSSGPWRFHPSPTLGTADTMCFMPSTKVAGCRTRSVWSSTSVVLAFKGPVGLWAPHGVLLWGNLLPLHLWVSWPLGPTCVHFQLFSTPPASVSLLSMSVRQALDEAGVPREAQGLPPTPPPATHSPLWSHTTRLSPLTLDAATAVTNTPPALLAFPLSSFSLSVQYWPTSLLLYLFL